MEYIIMAIVFLTLLFSLLIYLEVKNNRTEKLKLCKSILYDMLIVVILFFLMVNKRDIKQLITITTNIKSNQTENISIVKSIQNIVKELKDKNIIFVSDIFTKIDDFNNTLSEANEKLTTNIYKQQIISDKIDDIKQKIEETNDSKSKIIWVGE